MGHESLRVRSPAVLAAGLGAAQLIAWGTLYYPLAVLGGAVAEDLRVSRVALFGAFTFALAVSGLIAPATGRLIDRSGGRRPLVASAVIGATGLAILAASTTWLGLWAASALIGLAMGLGLYDAAFAAVAGRDLAEYRRIVSGVTILGGLASTVFWPLALALERAGGWRLAMASFALLLLCLVPVYLWIAPSRAARAERGPCLPAPSPVRPDAAAYLLTSLALATGALVTSAMSAHLIDALEQRGATHESAVAIGALVGPMQVVARAAELRSQRGLRASSVATLSLAGLAASLFAVAAGGRSAWLLVPVALTYGMANGALTVARASAPLEMFGAGPGAGALLGRLALPAQIARALGPAVFAAVAAAWGTTTAIVAMAMLALGGLGSHLTAARRLQRATSVAWSA